MSEQDCKLNPIICKHRGDCTRAYYDECPFGGEFEHPTMAERDNPKSVCWYFDLEADK